MNRHEDKDGFAAFWDRLFGDGDFWDRLAGHRIGCFYRLTCIYPFLLVLGLLVVHVCVNFVIDFVSFWLD
jgi:hypothetical protein